MTYFLLYIITIYIGLFIAVATKPFSFAALVVENSKRKLAIAFTLFPLFYPFYVIRGLFK